MAHYIASAELYDSAAGTFTLTGGLNTALSGQSATLLSNGNVLLAAVQNDNTQNSGYLSSAELYNASGTFRNTASRNTPRQGHASALLTNGQGSAAGGYQSQLGNRLGDLASAELFD